jgi:hypothetical protein
VVGAWGRSGGDIFGRGPGNSLFHKAWHGSDWYPSQYGWENLGGDVGGGGQGGGGGGGSGGGGGGGGGGSATPTCSVESVAVVGGTDTVRIYGGGFTDGETINITKDESYATHTTADALGGYTVQLAVYRQSPPREIVFQAHGASSGKTSNKAGYTP